MARGTVRQRSKVRKDSWTVQIYLGVDPVTGKKRYHSEAVKGTKAQAQRRLTELQRQVDTKTYTEPSRLTVGEYLKQWMQDYAESHVSRRTFEGYLGNLERYILPAIGGIALERLSARHTQEMESTLLRNGGKNGAALSPRTVLQFHRILSKALKDAVKIGILSRNVAEAVEPPRITRFEARTLSWDEIHQFLDNVDGPQYRTLFVLGIQTGLRRSELLGLRWRDIDLQTGVLSVQRALVKLPSGEKVLTVPKSGQARVITLPAQSVEALRLLWDATGHDSENGDFVFRHSDGMPLDPAQVTKKSKSAAVQLGVGDLRHTHASLMLVEGVHLKVTSERLGHSDIAITGDLYSHVQATVQQEAAERFEAAWSSTETGENSGMAKGMANSDKTG